MLIDRETTKVVPLLAACIYAIGFVLFWWWFFSDGELFGTALKYDFITFWAGSWLTLFDDPRKAYDPEAMFAVEQVAIPLLQHPFAWHYPPTFQLMVMPLAYLPHFLAYLLFMTLQIGVCLWVLRRLRSGTPLLILFCGFSGFFVALMHGQNSFLSFALIMGTLHYLERRPALAGVMIGLLAFKPHLAALFGVALLCGGYWKTLGVALMTAALFALATLPLFGAEQWVLFFHNLPLVKTLLLGGELKWIKMPTLFSFLALSGVLPSIALLAQLALALALALLVGYAWHTRPNTDRSRALLLIATLLYTPYIFDYDTLLLFGAGYYLFRETKLSWLTRIESNFLIIGYLMPAVGPAIAQTTSINVFFLYLFGALLMVLRRSQPMATQG